MIFYSCFRKGAARLRRFIFCIVGVGNIRSDFFFFAKGERVDAQGQGGKAVGFAFSEIQAYFSREFPAVSEKSDNGCGKIAQIAKNSTLLV